MGDENDIHPYGNMYEPLGEPPAELGDGLSTERSLKLLDFVFNKVFVRRIHRR